MLRGPRARARVTPLPQRNHRNEAKERQKQRREEKLRKKRGQHQLVLLPGVLDGVHSDDRNVQHVATFQFRLILAECSPPIEEVIQFGVVPQFVKFLTKEDSPQLQLEAAWALTNIASGTSENTKAVVDNGAVPIFVRLLASPSVEVREQAVWALGNIAGDSPECRDFVLQCGALQPLLAQLHEHPRLSMLRNATWTLLNFCGGMPQPSFDKVRAALQSLGHLIFSDDEKVLARACQALSYLSYGSNDKIQAVIEAGVCPRLIQLLENQSLSVLIPALCTVGNIITGNVYQTQCMIDLQVLPHLRNLLTGNYEARIKKEACWTISNITAGNKDQIGAVIHAEVIDPLINLLVNAELVVKKEAARAISNAACGSTHDQIKSLVRGRVIPPLCDLLLCPDPTIVAICLEGLESMLKVGEAEKNSRGNGVNLYAWAIEVAGGLENLRDLHHLQRHGDIMISEKMTELVQTYWSD